MMIRCLLTLKDCVAGKLAPVLRWIAIILTLAAWPVAATAQVYTVQIDTTALAGVRGFIAFDLVDGTTTAPSTLNIANFSSPGQLGLATLSGGATGSLPGPVTLSSTSFFNSLLQGIVFAAGLTSFSLNVSPSYQSLAIPDSFAIFLLDSTQAPFATSDPTGANALLVMDLNSPVVPRVFLSASASATVTLIPEPASWVLLALGLAALGWGQAKGLNTQIR